MFRLILLLGATLIAVSCGRWSVRDMESNSAYLPEKEHEVHVPVTSTRYPSARYSNGLTERLAAQRPANINVIGDSDVVSQSVINGQTIEICTPGKQVPQNEVTGAVNPQDPNNLLMGSNDYGFINQIADRYDSGGGVYRSVDGGKTWSASYLPGLIRWNTDSPGVYEAAGDPSIAATRENIFWYANLAFNRSTSETGIAVSRSTDGGANWKTSFVVENLAPPDGRILLNDKPWIAADPSNPEKAHITWTRFQTGDPFSPIAYSSTTNGGRTWSRPKIISRGDNNQGSHIVVDDLGGVHVVWFGYSGTTPGIQYRQKQGSRFKKPKMLSTIDPIRSPVAWASFYTNSFPSIAVDGETLHVVWPNWNGQDSDIVYIRSEDRGKTWSSPVAVDGRSQDQFLPRVAAFAGTVAIGYLDHYRERGSGYHVGVVISRDGGITWSKPKRVSTKGSDPEKGNRFSFPTCTAEFIGDYNGVAVGSDHRVHLFWTDIRSGNSIADPGSTSDQDPYTASIEP